MYGELFSQVALALYNGMWWIIYLGIIAVGGIVFYYWYVFNIKVVIREVLNGRRLVRMDRGRIISIRGVKYLRLFWQRQNIPTPPEECIDLMKRGKKFVEMYKHNNDQYQYIKDTGEVSQPFQALDTNDRILYLDNLDQATVKKKLGLAELVPMVANGMMLVVTVLILVVFLPPLFDKAMALMDRADQGIARMDTALRITSEACEGQQFINRNLPGLSNNVTVVPN